MSWILLALLAANPDCSHAGISPAPAVAKAQTGAAQSAVPNLADEIAADLETGCLIATQGDCLAVRIYTQSRYTHIAAVVLKDGKPCVYDSMNGVGVRCLSLEDYLNTQKPTEIQVLAPRKPFSPECEAKFVAHLESQLGRPYGIKHHLTGKRAEGIHCAEYVIEALMATNLMRANEPPRVSPASLIEGVTKSSVYTVGNCIALKQPSPEAPEDAGWCSRMWFDTKQCTRGCYTQMRRWFCCR